MGFSRVLGGIGRTMIASGVLILLFVVYQLWGTSLRTTGAQTDLRSQFEAAREAAARRPTPTTATTQAASNGGPPSTMAPTPVANLPAPEIGQPVGYINIPKIMSDPFAIVEGVDLGNLAKGPGHFPETPLPGQAGNAAIAGHRVTYLAPFNRIDELVPGDHIQVETFQGTFTYEVIPEGGVGTNPNVGHRIITPDQVEILDQPPGQNLLTLMACHPKFDLKQRIVVVGRLVGEVVPTTPKAEVPTGASDLPGDPAPEPTLDLVSGDDSARTPALLYGLVAGAIWLAAWVLARFWPRWRQWQRWAVFGAALPVFAVPLYLSFEAINRLLPAGY